MSDNSNQLIPGAVYFILLYVDELMTIPVIQTVIYRSARICDNGKYEHIFSEMKPDQDPVLMSVHEDDLESLVLNRAELLQRL